MPIEFARYVLQFYLISGSILPRIVSREENVRISISYEVRVSPGTCRNDESVCTGRWNLINFE